MIRYNKLNSNIPATLGLLSNLKELHLHCNDLSGIIPASLDSLQLDKLDLRFNRLSGKIPPLIGSHANHVNAFHGNVGLVKKNEYKTIVNILQELGYEKPEQFIDEKIRGNKIEYDGTGSIINITLDWSQITGVIPTSICTLVSLRRLNLSRNELRGCIPTDIGNLINLKELDLNNAHMHGAIPVGICKLVNLKKLYLNNNTLTESIPVGICNLVQLQYLNLSNNQLTGNIPKNIGKLVALKTLLLSHNQLTGCIPESIEAATKSLENLDVSFNQLDAPIPKIFATLPNMVKSFHGNIGLLNKDEYRTLVDYAALWGKENPKEFINENIMKNKIKANDTGDVIFIDLSHKELRGPLPSSIARFTHLEDLVLSKNNLNGDIPVGIAHLVNLKFLDLSFNEFTGTLPESLGSLTYLECLLVDNNSKLQGKAPTMESRKCVISIHDTMISRVEIITKSLKYHYDDLFVVLHIAIGYIDVILDIVALVALRDIDVAAMVANIVFVVLNVLIGLWLTRSNIRGIICTLLQVEHLYQGIMTIINRRQTYKIVLLKRIDSVFRSMPNLLIHFYGLLRLAASENTTTSRSSSGSSGSIALLSLSIVASILSNGFTLASGAPKSGHTIVTVNFIIFYLYYIVEILQRSMILTVMFFSIRAYGYIVAGIDYFIRLVIGFYSISDNNIGDGILIAIQSFCSDHSIPGKKNNLLYAGYAINTIEVFLFLIVFNTIKTQEMFRVKEQRIDVALSVLVILTWLIRLIVLLSQVLDKLRTDNEDYDDDEVVIVGNGDKTKGLASREDIIENGGAMNFRVTLHRIDSRKDVQ